MTTLQIPGYEDIAKSGWLPVLAAVRGDQDNPVTRGSRFLRLADYIEGEGTKPTTGVGMYLGSDGLVAAQTQATDISLYNGDQIQQYLRDVGLTVSDLPVVSVDDAGCVLGVIPASGGTWQWGAIKNIRATLLGTRTTARSNLIGDEMLLPDPRGVLPSHDDTPDFGHRSLNRSEKVSVAVWNPDAVSGADRDPDDQRPDRGHWETRPLYEQVVGEARMVGGYEIRVVDEQPSNPDNGVLYFVRES